MKKLITILFSIICAAAGALITYFSLASAGFIKNNDKIQLKFAINDEKKEYDGQPLVASEYQMFGTLQEGHHEVITYLGEQTQIGSSKSDINVKILDEKDIDVSNEYAITVISGNLEVNKRNLEISILNDDTLEYLSETVNNLSYKITDGSLVNYDVLTIGFDSSLVGSDNIVSKSCFIPKIYNSLGADVTFNYNCNFIINNNLILDGKDSLNEIEIEPLVLKKIYDGNPFILTEKQVSLAKGTLIKNDHISSVEFCKNENSIIDSGKYEATLKITILDSFGKDVTSSYSFDDTKLFEVVIDPQNVEVDLPILTKTYDGNPFSIQAILNGIDKTLLSSIDTSNAKMDTDISNACNNVSYTLEGIVLKNPDINHVLKINNGILTIKRNKVHPQFLSSMFIHIYDGNKFYLTYGTDFVLVGENKLELDSKFLISNIELENEQYFTTSAVQTKIKKLDVYLNGEIVNSNFIFDFSTSIQYKINSKNIDVDLIMPKGTYGDNKYLQITDIVSSKSLSLLAEGDSFVFYYQDEDFYSIGTYLKFNNSFLQNCEDLKNSIKIIGKNGEIVDDYYSMNVNLLDLNSDNISEYVAQKELNIILSNVEKVYDNSCYSLELFRSKVQVNGLAFQDSLQKNVMNFKAYSVLDSINQIDYTSVIGVGNYVVNVLEDSVYISNEAQINTNLSSWYKIIYHEGTIAVSRKTIEITLLDVTVKQEDIDSYSGIIGYINAYYILYYCFVDGEQYGNNEMFEISLIPTNYSEGLSFYGITVDTASIEGNTNYNFVIKPGSILIV